MAGGVSIVGHLASYVVGLQVRQGCSEALLAGILEDSSRCTKILDGDTDRLEDGYLFRGFSSRYFPRDNVSELRVKMSLLDHAGFHGLQQISGFLQC